MEGIGEVTLETPTFSKEAGNYDDWFTLEMTNPNPTGDIYYYGWSTRDEVLKYTGPILVNKEDNFTAYVTDGAGHISPAVSSGYYGFNNSWNVYLQSGTPINETTKDDIMHDGGSVKYNPETNTFTLHNANIDGISGGSGRDADVPDLHIEYSGTNYVSSINYDNQKKDPAVACTYITGLDDDAVLHVEDEEGNGISPYLGSLTFEGGTVYTNMLFPKVGQGTLTVRNANLTVDSRRNHFEDDRIAIRNFIDFKREGCFLLYPEGGHFFPYYEGAWQIGNMLTHWVNFESLYAILEDETLGWEERDQALEQYKQYNVSYVVVAKPGFDPGRPEEIVEPPLSWANTVDGSFTVPFQAIPEGWAYPYLNNPQKLPVAFASSNTAVAVVNEDGNVEALTPGVAIISAVFEGNSKYLPKTVSYRLTVLEQDAKDAELGWLNTEDGKLEVSNDAIAKGWSYPYLNNPHRLFVTYESSDPAVAAIDNNGLVKALSAGTTVISAKFAGNDEYNPQTVSYTLTVKEPVQKPEIFFVKDEHTYSHFVVEQNIANEMFTMPVIQCTPADQELSYKVRITKTPQEGQQPINATVTTDPLSITVGNNDGTGQTLVQVLVTATNEGGTSSAILEVKLFAESYVEPESEEVPPVEGETGVDFGSESCGIDAGTDLTNTAVGGGLLTLDPDEGDGYDPDEGCIVLGSTMTTAEVAGILEQLVPGTGAFAALFDGLTYTIPAGTDYFDIKFLTMGDRTLKVKIGPNCEATLTRNEMGSARVYYNCAEETTVMIYAASTGTAASRSNARHAMATDNVVKIYSINIVAQTASVPTGIIEVTTDNRDGQEPIYDLQGRRVEKPAKGLYIVGGKKKVVK